MAGSRIVPTQTNIDVVSYTLFTDGEELPGSIGLSKFNVTRQLDKISHARLEFVDGYSEREDWEVSGSAYFDPGKEIIIKLGYNNHTETIFRGIITNHRLKVSHNGFTLLVDARHNMYRSTLVKKLRTFKNISDSSIVQQILSEYGENADVESSEIVFEQVVQNHQTDWDFILKRARNSGMMISLNDNQCKLIEPDFDEDSGLSLLFGSSIKEADLEIDGRKQVEQVLFKNWDTDEQTLRETETEQTYENRDIELNAAALAGMMNNPRGEITQTAVSRNTNEPGVLSANALQEKALNIVSGHVVCNGIINTLSPGNWVKLEGMGSKFSGNHFVNCVTHNYERGQTTTLLQLGYPERFTENEAGYQGLEIGVVTDLVDPEEMDRILVQLPAYDGEAIWARLAVPDAGAGRGLLFRPEIGDEVIVSFIGGNASYPAVIGSLFSSNHPSPILASNENHIKGIVTRGGLKLLFHDEEKSISLQTPRGNSLLISEDGSQIEIKDMNDNSIKMDTAGISIESQRDLKIKVFGSLSIDASDVNIQSGLSGTFECGSAMKLSAAAILDISGGLVKIN